MLAHRLPGPLCVLAALLVGCKSDRPAAEAASAASPPATAATDAAPAPVTVTATDYKLDLPDTIPAGAVTMHLVNHGKEMHHAVVVRLEDGKTLADFQQAMKHEGPPPSWVRFVGGPNGIVPGQEATSTAAFTAGNYVVMCLIPGADGVPHMMKGMMRPFTVTGTASAAASALPAADDTVRMGEYSFEPTGPLTAGRHVVLVQNAGQQPHELVVLKLAPGRHVTDFGKWATTGGMKGPPPAMPVGGVGLIEPAGSATFSADLAPGSYGLICFVPDAKDGKPHLAHGMMKEFAVE